MAYSDPKQGGDLFDMAAEGTKVPGDAGKQNLIPSVPRPGQITDPATDSNNLGSVDPEGAADNATDIPRRTRDMGATGEVITGTGDQMPAQVESKRMHFGANDPLSKGHNRYDKHSRQKESDLERYAGDGAEMDLAPGEEDDSTTVRDRKGG